MTHHSSLHQNMNTKIKSQTSIINGCPVGLGFTMTLGGVTPLVLLHDDLLI